MPYRSYVGIDRNDNNEWIAALWTGDKVFLSRPFKNTPGGLADLVSFIAAHGERPKICLNPTTPTALRLIKCVGGIPDAEVFLISEAGLKVHRHWLSGTGHTQGMETHVDHAVLLARCAERMI